MTASPDVARRSALALIGGGAAAAAIAAPAAGAAARAAGGSAPLPDPLTMYLLMRGALDDRLVIGCVQGEYFGVVDGAMTPLFGLAAATFARYRPRAGGGYDVANGEVAYFTDLASGAFIESWANPYTGETVTIPRQGLPPSTFAILPDLTFKLARDFPGGSFSHHIQPAQVRGDDVWIPELTITSAAIPGQPPFHYSEMTTLHARLSDLRRPGTKQAGSETAFTNVVSWRPWMNMGARPGHMMAIGAGRYGATIATLPPALVAALRAKRPELLADPASLIAPLWK